MNALFGAPDSPPADSLLQHLDARLKLALLPLLIAATFAARDAGRLLLLGLVLLLLQRLAQTPWRHLAAKIYSLRWLLLATLLLHLFFTPGRTLLGIAWLSQDGLASGATIALQLTLALLFATLIIGSTDLAALTAAAAHLGAPLQHLGLPLHQGIRLCREVVLLLPLLRQESLDAYQSWRRNDDGADQRWSARGQRIGDLLAALLLTLADRVDATARESLNDPPKQEESLPPFFPPSRATLWALLLLATLFFCYLRIPAWNA